MCNHYGLDWEDIALVGSLDAEMTEEERECECLRKKVESEQVKEEEDSD